MSQALIPVHRFDTLNELVFRNPVSCGVKGDDYQYTMGIDFVWGKAIKPSAKSDLNDGLWNSTFSRGLGLSTPAVFYLFHYMLTVWSDQVRRQDPKSKPVEVYVSKAALGVANKSFDVLPGRVREGITREQYACALVEAIGCWRFRSGLGKFHKMWSVREDDAGEGYWVDMSYWLKPSDFRKKNSAEMLHRLLPLPTPNKPMPLHDGVGFDSGILRLSHRLRVWRRFERCCLGGAFEKPIQNSVLFTDAWVHSDTGWAILAELVNDGYLFKNGNTYSFKENNHE